MTTNERPTPDELDEAREALGPATHAFARAFVEAGVMTDGQALAWIDALAREHVLEIRRQRQQGWKWWRQ